MDGAMNNLDFVIDENCAHVVQTHKSRVEKLFEVKVNLGKAQQTKIWIKIKGYENQLSKAKDYIIALVNPDVTTSLKNIWGNPLFTEGKCADIERNSSAVLFRHDEPDDSLHIQGTPFSVTVARSLVDEVFSKSALDVFDGQAALGEEIVPEGPKKEMTECDLNLEPSNSKGKAKVPETRAKAGSSVLQSDGKSFSLTPHGREQQAYLRNLALSSKYEMNIVEEAITRFDMNEVIPPANFMRTVDIISKQKLKTSKQDSQAKTSCITSNKGLDASVICLDSSDEETYVMRPFNNTDKPQLQADLNGTIVLSSDDEQENKSQGIIIPSKKKSGSKTTNRSLADGNLSGGFVARGPPDLSSQQSKGEPYIRAGAGAEQSFAGNKDFTGSMGLLGEIPITGNQARDFMTENPELGAASGEHDEMQLRQDYINGLMRASPASGPRKGPRYIVIDGSNVAMHHGNNAQFSVRGIEICLKYFLSRGHNDITAFVPEWRRYGQQIPQAGKDLLDKLFKAGFVKFTPARRVGTQTIASYDDRYILNLAVEEEGIIVSNDQFRDLLGERESYREAVTKRLLQYTFVGNHFMPPEDPLGWYGPTLDQFLRYPIQQVQRAGISASSAATGPPRRIFKPCQDVAKPNAAKKNKSETERFLPLRSASETERLFLELIKVFPEPHQISCVRKVLDHHKRENDLNRLSVLCINAMAPT